MEQSGKLKAKAEALAMVFLGYNTDWPYHHHQRWYRNVEKGVVSVPVTVIRDVKAEPLFVMVGGTVVVVLVIWLIFNNV